MIKEIEQYNTRHKLHKNHIEIITIKHTLSAAKLLEKQLLELGYTCKLHEKMPLFPNPFVLYIVYAPQVWKRMPKHYIVYQVEQMTYDYCNNNKYFMLLNNATAILDYSMINVEKLKLHKDLADKLYFLPFQINTSLLGNSCTSIDKKYDVLFYGDTSSERRQHYLSELAKVCNLKIINKQFGDSLINEMSKAFIVLNIHFKDNAILETCRLTEALSYGYNLIISEDSVDKALDSMFKNYVDFVECGNLDAMKNKIQAALRDTQLINDKLVSVNNLLLQQESNFYSYFLEIFN